MGIHIQPREGRAVTLLLVCPHMTHDSRRGQVSGVGREPQAATERETQSLLLSA